MLKGIVETGLVIEPIQVGMAGVCVMSTSLEKPYVTSQPPPQMQPTPAFLVEQDASQLARYLQNLFVENERPMNAFDISRTGADQHVTFATEPYGSLFAKDRAVLEA